VEPYRAGHRRNRERLEFLEALCDEFETAGRLAVSALADYHEIVQKAGTNTAFGDFCARKLIRLLRLKQKRNRQHIKSTPRKPLRDEAREALSAKM
jgi:hypothetical protein